MRPKGIENVEAIIAACQKALEDLGPAGNPEWKGWLASAVEVLGEMKTRFFLKTNPAIPVTNRCREDAEKLGSLAASGDLESFPVALERLQKDMETLLKRSSMEGIIIT
jgi:hypothetical protein